MDATIFHLFNNVIYIYITNKIGPEMEPCGTPWCISENSDMH